MTYTIQQFFKDYPDNDTCLEKLFRMRFPSPVCPVCKRQDAYHRHGDRASFICNCGKHEISPKQGTIFAKSDTDLVKWFHALFLMSQSRNGVAAKELERQVGVTYKTAWRMQRLIRSTMRDGDFTLSGTVEADDAAIGGKNKGRGRWGENKTLIVGTVERKGKLKASVIPDLKADTLAKHLQENVARGSRLITDRLQGFKKATRLLDMEHEAVNHSAKEYTKGDAHVNTIEGFFSQLKRSLDGTYHVVSPKYLPLYVAEFEFRYNARLSPQHLFHLLMARVAKRPA
jgi:transposase